MKTLNLISRLTTLVILTFFSCNIFASVKISGTLESAKNEAIPFANVTIMQNDKLITGTVSDNNGHFELNMEKTGIYTLTISHILYMPFHEEEKITNEDIDLGIIKLSSNSETLHEVQVIAHDIIQKPDKDVIVMNKKYTAQAANTEQIFQMIPNINVDMLDKKIKVGNNENVLLQVNGIPKDEQYIRTLDPSRIKKIEIIKNVTGRYANEYDAILNIITDNEQTGYNISAQNFTYATFEDRYNDIVCNVINVTGSWFTAKTNVYAGYTNRDNTFYIPEETEYKYEDGFTVNKSVDRVNNLFSRRSNKVYFGTDYTFKPGHILSFETSYSFSPYSKNKRSSKSDVTTTNSGELLNEYTESYTTKAKNINPYILVSYEGKINSKNSLSGGLTFYNNKNTYSNNLSIDELSSLEQGEAAKNYVEIYLEDKYEISEKTSLDINYNYRSEKTKNSYISDGIQEPNTTNSFKKHNAGVYLNYSFSENTGVKAGCAAENIKQNYESESSKRSSDQIVALPYLSFKHTLSKALSLQLNYKVNTKNPKISQMSSYTSVIDSFTTKTGNPLLKPSYYHYVSGKLNIAGGKLALEPYYKFGKNSIAYTGTLTDDHIVNYTYNNKMDYQKFGIELSGSLSKKLDNKDMLFFSADIDNYLESAKYEGKSHHISDFRINASLAYISQKHNATFATSLNKVNTKRISAMGYEYSNNDFLALTVKKSFCKDICVLSANYITPFTYGLTTKIDDVENTQNFTRINSNDVSCVQNSFTVELVVKLSKNKNTHHSNKRRIESDAVQTGF